MADDLMQAREDIEEAFFGLGDDDIEAHAAKARLLAFLARVEALSSPEGLITELREMMAEMKPEQRCEVMAAVGEAYCRHCGYAEESGRGCFCMWDE